MTAFYNEIDPFAAAWLRQLISAGHIAPGVVDERDIRDIEPSELRSFTQCHFFAGIGVWSYGLRLAGWSDNRPIWTGSCPCQPFSASGKRGGFDDERHLWPAWQYLIEQCGPPVVAGEQVASKDGYAWLDLVQADLEGMGYACGAVVSPSAGYGAPHERHRQFFGAIRLVYADDTNKFGNSGSSGTGNSARSFGRDSLADRAGAFGGMAHSLCDGARSTAGNGIGTEETLERNDGGLPWSGAPARIDGASSSLADTELSGRRQRGRKDLRRDGQSRSFDDDGGATCRVADADGRDTRPEREQRSGEHRQFAANCRIDDHGSTGPTNGFWRDADWLFCRDERWRPVEPGTFPLAHGASARMGRLRGYGNAINAYQAKAFIEAFAETIDGTVEITGVAARG